MCGRSSAVEHNLAKVGVDGSNPFARSIIEVFLIRNKVPNQCISLKLHFRVQKFYTKVFNRLKYPCPGGGMVDTGDLKSPGHCDRAGSSPAPGTTIYVEPSPSW